MRRLLLAVLACGACSGAAAPTDAPAPTDASAPAEASVSTEPEHPVIDRLAFNQAAARQAVPLFKRADGKIVQYNSPLLFDDYKDALARVELDALGVEPRAGAATGNAAMRAELDSGRMTLLETDFSDLTPGERTFVRRLMKAGQLIESLHGLQKGVPSTPPPSPEARMLNYRNQGPWCVVEECGTGPAISGLYPASIQSNPDFCAMLSKDHPDVMKPFMVAVDDGSGGLKAVPYHVHWAEGMGAVANEVKAAADALDADQEGPQRAYLRAVAKAFGDGTWFEADAAWAKVNQNNSKWYLRLGPDEVYYDPCGEHAGFHLQIAKVSGDGLAWQQKLDPVKQDMEAALATIAGPPYKARTVGFDLPEFIEVVANFGDARNAQGATVGQSLPNWGPVSDAGGRTVAMTNIGVDPDSLAAKEATMASLFCADTLPSWTSDPAPQLASTILHEAAHNLGPSGEYKVDGQTDSVRFGGSLASMMEELKAQTAALYLSQWLVEQGHSPKEELFAVQLGDIGWAFGQIANGFTDATGRVQVYPQLAAVQMGMLLDAGALKWSADETAANSKDKGCYSASADALPAAVDAMASRVFKIKAQGDRTGAESLRDTYAGKDSAYAPQWATITERMRRQPRPTYVYRLIWE